jgi:hypothetical protein
VIGRVFVFGFKRIRQGLDGREERPLEVLEGIDAVDRHLCLVRDTCEEAHLALRELVIPIRRGAHDQAAEATAIETQWCHRNG